MMPENVPSLDPMRHSRDHWKCQALIYMKELTIVNRACERKARTIDGLRHKTKCLEEELKYMTYVVYTKRGEGGK